MPTTNNDDILEIDLPDTQEDLPVPDSSFYETKKKPGSIELDRVSALMAIFVAFGVVLIAICDSALNPIFFNEVNYVVITLCGFTAVGLVFAQTVIVAEFFVRSNTRLVYRVLIAVLFLFAVLYCSTHLHPTDEPRDMTVLQLLLWSVSAIFQLIVQWTILFIHQKASKLPVDSKVFLSSWGNRPSHLARILLMLVLLAVFFASLTQAEFLLRNFGAGPMTFIGLMLLLANLIWAALIVFPQVRVAASVLVIAGIVAFISLLPMFNDPEGRTIWYPSFCVAFCIGWLACGGLIKTVAVESNLAEAKRAAHHSKTGQPSNDASPG